ncbi:hypothetical protein [Edwardsiella hoshinae]|uniref:hypothetical protein n=1 Tax=Edwardsiella hoshinae TaxID=93378 RepID=UPI001FD81BCE|nr:hypothetical protein [Edwardsiella hoshinae]
MAIVTRQVAIGIAQRQDFLIVNDAAIFFMVLGDGRDVDSDIGSFHLNGELTVGAECVKTVYIDGVVAADLPQLRLVYCALLTEGGGRGGGRGTGAAGAMACADAASPPAPPPPQAVNSVEDKSKKSAL